MSQELRKEKAIEIMKQLGIYGPYINGFKSKQSKVCFFENFAGFWAYQEPELQEKIKEIEEKHNCTVYAITHEYTEFGELYDFLIVTSNEEEWDTLVEKYNNEFYVFAYVWNKTDDWSSEFGEIGIRSFGGGIKRTA